MVEGLEEFTFTLPDGRAVPGTLVGGDFFTDLPCRVKDKRDDAGALPLRDSDKLVIGETVIAIGSPLWVEGGPTVTVLTTSA